MDQDLQRLCEEMFCKQVDKLLAEKTRYRQNGRDYVEAPFIGGYYAVEHIGALKRLVSKAVIARSGWEIQKPHQSPPLPTLPLRTDESAN
jgi:hypothetical protein